MSFIKRQPTGGHVSRVALATGLLTAPDGSPVQACSVYAAAPADGRHRFPVSDVLNEGGPIRYIDASFANGLLMTPDGRPIYPIVAVDALGVDSTLGGGGGGGGGLTPYLGQVATRSAQPTAVLAQTKLMSRVAMYATEALSSFQLKFGNWYTLASGESTSTIGSAVTYTASIEYPAGTFTQIKWAGSASVVAAIGSDTGLCDAITTAIPKDAKFFVRVYATTTAAGIPHSNQAPWNAGGDASVVDGTATDLTMSGTVTGANIQGIFPLCVVQTTTRPSFMFLGDSRSASSGTQDANGNAGQFGYGIGSSYGYISGSMSGTGAFAMIGAGGTRRNALAQYVTHVINGMGVNDIFVSGRTLPIIQSLFNTMAYQMPGKRHILATISPDTTSTDSWATTANQTTLAAESVRVAFNTWAKTLPDPYFACLDIASVTESVSAPGKWNPGYTNDGLHQNPTAAAAIQAAGVVNHAALAGSAGLLRFSPFQFGAIEWYDAADYFHNSGNLAAVDGSTGLYVGSTTFSTTSFNGGPGYGLTTAGQYFYRQPGQAIGRNTNALTLAILWTPSANPASNMGIAGYTNGLVNTAQRAFIMVDTSGRPGLAIRRLDADAVVTAYSTTAMTIGNPYLLVLQCDIAAGVAYLYVNGVLACQANYASTGSTENTASIGAYIGFLGAQAARGTIGEYIGLHNAADATRQKIEGDMAWRRGAPATFLPANHPYYSTRPAP